MGWTGFQGVIGEDAAEAATTDLINILDTVEVPIVVVRHDFRIAGFNKAAADVLDLSPSDFGRATRDVSVLAGLPRLEDQCGQVMASGVESRVDFRDGDKWFVVRISPCTRGDRQVNGAVLTFTNVTAFRASIDQAIYEREFTKTILNAVTDPLVVLSADQRIQSGNRAFYAMFGLSRDETQGTSLYALGYSAFDVASLRMQLTEMLAGSHTFQPVEIDRVLTARGERTLALDARTLSFRGHPERRVLVTFQDITERKQAEAAKDLRSGEELRRREAKIRRLVEANVVGIVMWTLDGPISEANEAFLHMVQYDRQDIISGRVRWTDLTPPQWRDRDERALAGLKATGIFQPFEKECLRKDGSRVPVLVGGALLEGSGNEGVAFVLDLTGQKQAEERVLKNEERTRLILDEALDAVVTMDADGVTTGWNKQAEAIFGRPREDAVGRRLSDMIIPAQHREAHERGLRHFLATGEGAVLNRRIQMTALARDGREFPVELSVTPLELDQKWTFSAFIRDITERKHAEEALRTTEARLSRATQIATVGELSASIAHEINQPLAAVLASAQACVRFLSAQPPNVARAQEAAESIVRDGKEAGEVVRRIRALFKRAVIEKVMLNLNDVIGEVLRLLASEAARRQVVVEADLKQDLPLVPGDRVQLQQVLLNLLLNGIEAMDSVHDRSRKLTVRSTQERSETVLVEVRDNGVGLENPDGVFEAFVTTKQNGMGMGLTICRSIVEAHNGRLWAVSAEGPGATFCFALPVRLSAES